MNRGLRLTVTAAVMLFSVSAHGQTLLQQLQKRIEEASKKKSAPTGQSNPGSGQSNASPANQGQAGQAGQAGFVADDHGKSEGIEILTIDAGGAAALANLKQGDRIVSVDGKLVKTLDDLAKSLAGRQANAKVRLGVVRGGKLLEKTMTLQGSAGPLPGPRQPLADRAPQLPPPQSNRAATLGVTVDALSESYRRRNRIAVPKGAVITSIVEGSPAHRYRLPLGGVIVAVGTKRINNPEDLRLAVAGSRLDRDLEITYYHQNQLYRRRLNLAPARPAAPIGPAVNTDRGRFRGPVLQRLERVLDRVVDRPEQAGSEVQLLRRQVDLLQAELERLRRRVDQLERAGGSATRKQ